MPLLIDRIIAVLILSNLVWSCKATRQSSSPLADTIPTRNFSQEPASENWGEYNCDEKGRSKQRLVLSLDIMSTGPAGLPTCMKPLDSNFVLGNVVCVDPSSEDQVDLFAGQLEQVCMTNSAVGIQAPDRTLAMPGCKKIRLIGHSFVPELRISGESRDIQ